MINTVSTSTNSFLADLSNLEQRINTVQGQITSGLRIQNVSDAPDQVGAVLQLKANLAQNDQMKVNLTTVQSEVNAAESAINTAGTLMNQAIQLAAQGANSVTSFSTRQQLASQVKDIIGEMYGLANTKFEGRYVFSGQNDQVAPYAAVDLTQANGVGLYQGSSLQRSVRNSDGSLLTYSMTADQIFDSTSQPGTSVFQTLTALYNDLNANDISAVSADASNLSTATSFLSAQQSQYGSYQNIVADGLTYQNQLDVQYQQQLSAIQDTDTISAATTLQQNEISMQAALQAEASLPKKSLFDYLG
jgi:flagellar hook-associated protein 3 FlgL